MSIVVVCKIELTRASTPVSAPSTAVELRCYELNIDHRPRDRLFCTSTRPTMGFSIYELVGKDRKTR